MKIKKEVEIFSISDKYYYCSLSKDEGNVILDFENIKLVFDSCLIIKCGYPNEEIYLHYDYYTQGGMRKHILYEILESKWINSLLEMNKVHPRHEDRIFDNDRHFIILFEDEVFECIASGYTIV